MKTKKFTATINPAHFECVQRLGDLRHTSYTVGTANEDMTHPLTILSDDDVTLEQLRERIPFANVQQVPAMGDSVSTANVWYLSRKSWIAFNRCTGKHRTGFKNDIGCVLSQWR